jgi:hypothetical protein
MGALTIYTRHRKELDFNSEFLQVVQDLPSYTFKQVILAKGVSDYRAAANLLKKIVQKSRKMNGLFFEWLLEHVQKDPKIFRKIIEDLFVDLLDLDVQGLLVILKTWGIEDINLILQDAMIPTNMNAKKYFFLPVKIN